MWPRPGIHEGTTHVGNPTGVTPQQPYPSFFRKYTAASLYPSVR